MSDMKSAGGLSYTLAFVDEFSAQVANFKAAIATIKAEFNSLRQEAASISSDASRSTQGLSSTSQAMREQNSVREETVRVSKRSTEARTMEQQALDNVVKQQERAALKEMEYQIRKERGLLTDREKTKALKEQAAAAEEAAGAEEALTAAQVAANIAARADFKREVNTELLGQSRAPSGMPIGQTGIQTDSKQPDFEAAQYRAKALAEQVLEQERLISSEKEKGAAIDYEAAQARMKLLVDQLAEQETLIAEQQAADKEGLLSAQYRAQARVEELAAIKEAADAQAAADKQSLADAFARGAARVKEIEEFNAPAPAGPTNQEIAQQNVQKQIQRLEVEKLTKEYSKQNVELQNLRDELGKNDTAANRISFTFRRLIGIFAAFTAVRLVIGALKDAITESIKFNAEMEAAQLGIASLYVASGKVSDATGAATDATQAFTLAQKAARTELQLIRVDALHTAATVDELVRAYQSAAAPGLTNGLSLAEIRKLTVSISQAASTLGMAQTQLPEEIRSLLQGVISPRNTRIATALGITNEDIAHAKEMGNLFEFLQGRFQAFGRASEEGLKTFTIRLANAKDALIGLLSTGLSGFFTSLSGLLEQIQTKLLGISDTGIVINPEAVRIMTAFGTALTFAVDQVKLLIDSFSGFQLEALLASGAMGLKAVVVALEVTVEGVLKGLSAVATALWPIILVIQSLLDAIGPFLQQVLVWGVASVVVFKSLVALTTGWGAAFAQVVKWAISFNLLQREGIYATAGDILARLMQWGFVIAENANLIGQMAVGVLANYLIWSSVKEQVQQLTGATEDWGTFIKSSITNLGQLMLFAATEMVDAFQTGFAAIALLAEGLALELLQMFHRVAVGILSAFGFDDLSAALNDTLKEMEDSLQTSMDKQSAIVGGFTDRFMSGLRKTREEMLLVHSLSGVKAGGDFTKASNSLDPIVGNSLRGMEQLSALASKLDDAYSAAKDELRTTLATLGSEGAVLQQLTELSKARIEIEKEGKLLIASRTQAERELLAKKTESIHVEAEIARLGEDQKVLVKDAISRFEQVLSLKRSISVEENKQAQAKIDMESATSKGDVAAAAAAKDRFERTKGQLDFLRGGLDVVQAKGDEKASNVSEDRRKQALDLAAKQLKVDGEAVDAKRKIRDATSDIADLEQRVYRITEARIATIGAKEYFESQRRLRETQVQVEAARRDVGVAGSFNQDEVAVTGQANAIAAERSKLEELKKSNREQENGLTIAAKQVKNIYTRIALEAELNQRKLENASKEELAQLQIDAATKRLGKLVQEQAIAHSQNVLSITLEAKGVKDQVQAQERLLAAKRAQNTIDDKIAVAENNLTAAKTRLTVLDATFKLEREKRQIELDSTKNAFLAIGLQQELNLFVAKNAEERKLTLALIKAANYELNFTIQNELQLAFIRGADNLKQANNTKIAADNARRDFESRLTYSKKIEELSGAIGQVATANRAYEVLKRSTAEEERKLRIQIQHAASYKAQAALVVDLTTLQAKHTEELMLQKAALDDVTEKLQKMRARMEEPIESGFKEAIQDFVHDAPTSFDITVDAMRKTLDGFAKVGADTLSGMFDPRNTTTFKQRLGELLLSIGNSIFEGLIKQAMAGLLKSSFSGLFEGAGLSTAAVELTAAGNLWMEVTAGLHAAAAELAAAGAVSGAGKGLSSLFSPSTIASLATPGMGVYDVGASLFATGGAVGFASGGQAKDPRDTIPAWLSPGEFVLRPSAVETLGLDTLHFLNGLTPSSMGANRFSKAPASFSAPAPSQQQTHSRQEAKTTVVPVTIATPDAFEKMLAQGEGPMQSWLAARGYRPS
jgi:hypothetical protein